MNKVILQVITGVGGVFLGVVIARVIGFADGLGAGIGLIAGTIVGFKIIEKRKKEVSN